MNTKPEIEVWNELREHLAMITALTKQCITQKIHAQINDVHIVELIELKNWIKQSIIDCECGGTCGKKLFIGCENNRYVIVYKISENATIRIYSNPIILN
jgi:exopolysaccharide biosynthesis predicted pyruvyltransferase EpsI